MNKGRTQVADCRLDSLALGVNFIRNGDIIVYRGQTGELRATRNRCRHQGGRFKGDGSCTVTCPHHTWRLNLSTMQYLNPTGGGRQEELGIEITGDRVLIYERTVDRPWESPRMRRDDLSPGELTVRFYTHACCEIRFGSQSVFTDPWLIGPAFLRGWWLALAPPDDWLDRLARADAVYISHNHSDHLNESTLRVLAGRNPDVPIYVPEFDRNSCVHLTRQCGMHNVRAVPFETWINFNDQARMMILRDGTDRDDSGLLFEYRGHRILDTVDCADINGGVVPSPVDLLMTNFAGGASGYPVCWDKMLTEEQITQHVTRRRKYLASRVVEMARRARPRFYMPFAGYFTEAHPADVEIKRRNVKNKPLEITRSVAQACPNTICWTPNPGEVLDLTTGNIHPANRPPPPPAYGFENYTEPIRESLDFEPLQSVEGIVEYFRWSGYRGDLILHVMETEESFDKVLRDYLIDLSIPKVVSERPTTDHRYLRMNVRSDVFRHVLIHGLPWEEISIGFQARFYREPNVYNFDFWDHFQNNLPDGTPWAAGETAGGTSQNAVVSNPSQGSATARI